VLPADRVLLQVHDDEWMLDVRREDDA